MLGIYAFKASSPVPTVATHPNLLPLIQLTKAEMDAQAGSSSFSYINLCLLIPVFRPAQFLPT